MSTLILVRHGQSTWNAENRFTGWVDVNLSENGIKEAEKSAELIKKTNIKIHFSYTSYLKRSIKTLEIILKENNAKNEYKKFWQLNERHYGSLTGLNKEETKKKIGEIKFKEYRRSWDIAPPPINKESDFFSKFSDLNINIPNEKVPLSESLKDTYNRVIPFYKDEVEKKMIKGKNILISAHGNSLRALCKYLFKITNTEINELEIPTGNPLIIEFNENLEISKYVYLDINRSKAIIFKK